jgi:hypothetical protein
MKHKNLQLTVRDWKVKPSSYDKKQRTVEAILTTNEAVKVFDWSYGEIVEERLVPGGMILPETGKLPLLDAHQRSTYRNVIGHCRDIKVHGDKVTGKLYFSDDQEGRAVEKKILDGHLDSVSIGYEVQESKSIVAGESYVSGGVEYEGPVRITTKWKMFEVSAVPIGADSKAKIRSQYMDTDQNTQDGVNLNRPVDKIETKDEILKERERCEGILRACRISNLHDFGQGLISKGIPLERAMDLIFQEMERINPPLGAGRIEWGIDDATKRTEAMVDGLVIRAGYKLDKTAPGAENFRNLSLVDMAKTWLEENTRMNTRNLTPSQAINKAMLTRTHTTSDFPHLLENVGNKMLLKAYENAPASFKEWTTEAEARDFKELSRANISEAEDLEVVGEAAEYKYSSFGEVKEVYKIRKHGRLFKISWESLVNDDLGAFDRIARSFVGSARRGLNAAVYSILVDNDDMADGIALFHEDHGNLAGTGTALLIDNLSAARKAMRTQKGMKSDYPLNIEPKHLIVPASLETAADQIINTMTGLEATQGAGAHNPFYQKLNVVVDPFLDQHSEVAWYLAGNQNVADTVEVAYLDGQRTPYIDEDWDFTSDAWNFKIRFCWGVKALDYRALYKNPGNGD